MEVSGDGAYKSTTGDPTFLVKMSGVARHLITIQFK